MIIKRKRNIEKKIDKQEVTPTEVEKTKVEPPVEEDILAKFSIDNINFEQRAERRQGSRRRGYRRIDDRNLISRAQEEAISIKEIATKDGRLAGIESAKEDLARLNSSIDEFFAYKDKVYEELTSGIFDISVEIAKKILNNELKTNDEAILNIIQGILDDNAKGENRITIKVMPDDVDNVKENLPDKLADSKYDVKINVVPDADISMGGAIIETSNGIIDATIESQIQIIQEAFKKI
ncbi:MAG: flagellar assembly protein FliH [Candidatus Gastranaerophilales bacterium]|nr:flagellar assembly protein FliH [Candidatus Gastranaerophilales bacterium]